MSDVPRVTVPAELVEALREALDVYPDATLYTTAEAFNIALMDTFKKAAVAARALVDAAERPAAPVSEPLCRCGHPMSNHSDNGCNGVGGTGDPCFCSPLVACPKCGHALDSPDGCSECPPAPVSDEAEAEAGLYLIRNRKTGEWFMGSVGGDDGIWAANIAMSVVYSSQTGPVYGLPEGGEWVRFRAARQAGKDEQ